MPLRRFIVLALLVLCQGTLCHRTLMAQIVLGYSCTRVWMSSQTTDEWLTLPGGAVLQLPRGNGMQTTGPIPLGFDFYYFGERFQSIEVTSTGRVYFGSHTPGVEEMCIVQFADTLTVGTCGAVWTGVVQQGVDRIFVCEFQMENPRDSTALFQWQLQLNGTDMSIKIVQGALQGQNANYGLIPVLNQLIRRDSEALYYNFVYGMFQDTPFQNYWLRFYRRCVMTFTPVHNCWHPTGMTVSATTENSTTVSWKPLSNAARYVVRCQRRGAASPDRVVSTQQASVTLTGLLPGTCYELSLHAVCLNGGRSDTLRHMVYTLCNDSIENPFRYWDLYDASVSCLSGSFFTPSTTESVIDYGSESPESRHTVHCDLTEYDSRTNNQLKTVPPGYCYSVRLGNWLSYAQQEEIVYRVRVDTGRSDLLLLRYAIVEENPNHLPEAQPHFIFSIRDSMGNVVDSCLYANFVAGDLSGWNTVATQYGYNIVWHDWMSVGVDLSPYHGQEIQIHLDNADCAQGGHFGYAYFVLENGTKRLASTSCGETVENTFIAPAGFAYRWYNAANPETTLSTGRSLHVTQAGTYCCWASYLHKGSQCGFTLYTRAGPRYPMPRFTAIPINSCGSEVYFNNQSVVTTDWEHHNLTNESCESFLWHFDDGTTSTLANPTHTFQGADIHWVTLTAMLANGACADSTTDFITVNYPRDTVYDTLCPGIPYMFDKYVITDSGRYTTQDDCGPHWLFLSYWDTTNSSRYDTLCAGDTLWIGNTFLTDSGLYSVVFPDVRGCDSTVQVNLTVHPTYFVRVKDTLPVGEYITVGDTQFVAPALGGTRLESIDGCDSTIWVRLSCIKTEDSTVCVDALPVEWGGYTFTQEGTDTSWFKSRVGTDSLHVGYLHVRPYKALDFRVVSNCEDPMHYLVTFPLSATLRWHSDPALEPFRRDTVDGNVQLYFRPTTETHMAFVYDYADAPSCPRMDTVALYTYGNAYLVLDVQPETLTSDNLHLTARDLGRNILFRQWVVDTTVQTETGTRLGYDASPMADSVVVTLIGGANNCVDTARKVVPIVKENVFIPNVFTPGEEENNRFYVVATDIETFELRVYDRRGVQVFHTSDINEGWDGTWNGVPCQQGAYAYVCRYTLRDGMILTKAGTVTLLR